MRGKGLKACAVSDFLPAYKSRNEERFLVAAPACGRQAPRNDSSGAPSPPHHVGRLLGLKANSASGVESLLP